MGKTGLENWPTTHFILHHHSLTSLFMDAIAGGLPRLPRFWFFLFCPCFQLLLVLEFDWHTTLQDIAQVGAFCVLLMCTCFQTVFMCIHTPCTSSLSDSIIYPVFLC